MLKPGTPKNGLIFSRTGLGSEYTFQGLPIAAHMKYLLPKPRTLNLFKLRRSCLIEEKLDGWRMVIWKGHAYGRKTDSLGRWINKWNQLPYIIQAAMTSIPVDGELCWPGKDASAVSTGLKKRSPKLKFVGFRIADKELYPAEHLFAVQNLSIPIPRVYTGTYRDNRTLDLEHLVQVAKEQKIEGWILKERYKVPTWWKFKLEETYDLIVTGFRWPTSGRNLQRGWIKALECSVFKNDQLQVIAHVSGMTDAIRTSITEKDIGRVVEVQANLLASKGRLKHPRFIRWRDDKDAAECRL